MFVCVLRRDLLCVCPVHGAVHAHRDAQRLQLPVLSDARQDGRQPRRHQVGGPEGDHGADLLDGHAVVVGGAQVQVLQHAPGVTQALLVPEGETGITMQQADRETGITILSADRETGITMQ